MSLRCVRLPPRPIKSRKSFELRPSDSDLTMIGFLTLKSEEKMELPIVDVNGKESVRRVSDSHYLIVWKDNVSRKVFWWEGRRHNAYMLTLFSDERTYNSWPCQLFELRRRNKAHIKQFIHHIKSWGLQFSIPEDEQGRIDKQKRKLIAALLEAVGARRRTRN